MAKTIRQAANIEVSPTKIYRAFIDDSTLSEITGTKTKIMLTEDGGKISIGDAKATVLSSIKNKMLVAKLKTKNWAKGELDAVVTIAFAKAGEGSTLEIFSSNVPEENLEEVKAIWKSILAAVKKSVK